jgi:hypothetical protein
MNSKKEFIQVIFLICIAIVLAFVVQKFAVVRVADSLKLDSLFIATIASIPLFFISRFLRKS